MTLPIWPADLPQAPLVSSYQETLPETAIRTKMDHGPAKLRQRTTAGTTDIVVSYLLSRTQVQTLDDFFLTELSGGSSGFTYPHPRREVPVTARFRKPPQLSARSGQYYTARLELEILP